MEWNKHNKTLRGVKTTKDNCYLNICPEKLKLYYSKKYEFKVFDSVCGNRLVICK
jgi:hypothetical protein